VAARARQPRPDIPIPGDVLQPRAHFAEDIHVSEKTVTRMNLPTTYVGNVAYVARNASLKIIADTVRRRNEPVRHRRSK
jgi:hypothetical protein